MTQDFKQTALSIVMGSADATLLNSNANKASERTPVMKNIIAGEAAKLAADQFIPKEVLDAHHEGVIHFHDMDESPLYPMFNCCLVDLKEMLANGFKMGNAEIETPKSISTAAAVTAQIIAQIACHQYGGVSINSIDEVLAEYVDKSYYKHLQTGKQYMSHDKAVVFATEQTHKEVQSACQGLEYEVNTLFTSQGQTPFVTFGFGLGTSWQARAVQKAVLDVRIKGLGKQGRTAIFPKLVYKVDDNINMKEGDPNYDMRKLAMECASRRNYPDVLSMPILRRSGGGCTPMGCRSFLHEWHDNNGNAVWDGRNNLGVVSLNLPRVALESSCVEEFWKNLPKALDLCFGGLMARIDRLKGVKAKVAPILYCTGALGFRLDPEDDIMEVFADGRSSISLGYIGLHEMCNAMFGTSLHTIDSVNKQRFAQDVVRYLKETCNVWKAKTGWAFGLYSTPSESLCDRFCRIDAGKFGIIDGVTSRGYYTNSFHLDVEKQVSPMRKIDFEMPYHKNASGGHITFVEIPNIAQEYKLTYIDEVWKYANERVPYFGTNCRINFCHNCNTGGEITATNKVFKCRNCETTDMDKLEITERVCGYLGNPNTRPFIDGKQIELEQRIRHEMGEVK